MTGIEFLALILGILILAKVIIFFVKPKLWMSITKKTTKNKVTFSVVSLVVAIIAGYLVLQEMTIAEIGAVTVFIAALSALSFGPYINKITTIADEASKDLLKKSWLSIVIWVALGVWMIVSVI